MSRHIPRILSLRGISLLPLPGSRTAKRAASVPVWRRNPGVSPEFLSRIFIDGHFEAWTFDSEHRNVFRSSSASKRAKNVYPLQLAWLGNGIFDHGLPSKSRTGQFQQCLRTFRLLSASCQCPVESAYLTGLVTSRPHGALDQDRSRTASGGLRSFSVHPQPT